MSHALRSRDVGALLQLVQRHTGASQARIASAVGLTQSRVNEVINGKRRVERLDVIDRVAAGLDMPDAARMLLGLAPSIARSAQTVADLSGIDGVVTHTYAAQATAARDIRSHVLGAHGLDVMAVRGLGLLGLNDSLLHSAVTRPRADPLVMRVLLLDPDCDAARRRAEEIGEGFDSFAAGIRMAEQRLTELAARATIRIEGYRYRTMPVWRIIVADDTIFMSTYDADWEGHASPVYRLDAGTGGALHRGVVRMFTETVAGAVRFL